MQGYLFLWINSRKFLRTVVSNITSTYCAEYKVNLLIRTNKNNDVEINTKF
jgi:hypothetical protein